MDCLNCAAPLPAKSAKCGHCGTLNDVDLRTVHRSVASTAASDRTCPRCETLMESVDLGIDGGFFIERCDRCLGLFFDPGELEHVLSVSVEDVHEVDRERLHVMIAEEYADTPKPVKYIKCPVCGALMNRRIFGAQSGVIVDGCRHHGVWLDGGELAQIVKWAKAGGRILDAEAKERDIKNEKRKKRLDAHRASLRSGSEVGHTSSNSEYPLVEVLRALFSCW